MLRTNTLLFFCRRNIGKVPSYRQSLFTPEEIDEQLRLLAIEEKKLARETCNLYYRYGVGAQNDSGETKIRETARHCGLEVHSKSEIE